MIHPLFRLIASEPQMLADHVEAYSELVGEEMGNAITQWKRTVVAAALLGVLGLVTLALAGVAVMLWAVTPPENLHAPWALVIVPLAPALVAAGFWFSAKAAGDKNQGFAAIKAQIAADAAMLRSVSEP
jgi:uncharacterized membrane protein YqjE